MTVVFATGKSGKSTPSVSSESINRSPEQRRRSKSILKRHQNQAASQAVLQDSQSSIGSNGGGAGVGTPSCVNHTSRIGIRRTGHVDPETEKLIPDNLSDCSPGKSPMTPPQQQHPSQQQQQPSSQQQQHKHNNNNNNNGKNGGRTASNRAPVEVALLQDLLEDSGGPIFICPPPPPMNDNTSDKRYS